MRGTLGVTAKLKRLRTDSSAAVAIATGLRMTAQLVLSSISPALALDLEQRWEGNLDRWRNAAHLPVAHTPDTTVAVEAQEPSKFGRPAVVGDEFDVSHAAILHTRCNEGNTFV